MGFDKGDKFIDDAKQRAHDAIGESNPKLTSLEKGFLHAMKRRQAREKHARKGSWDASTSRFPAKKLLQAEPWRKNDSLASEPLNIKLIQQ